MARKMKGNDFDFSTILFLAILQTLPDGTPQSVVAKKHDEYIVKNRIGIDIVSQIGNSRQRLTRTVDRLRHAGIILDQYHLTLNVERALQFWRESGMDMNDWTTWELHIPEEDGWFIFEKVKPGSNP